MDARFVLVEIGRLTESVERNTRAIENISGKVEEVGDRVKSALLVGKVLIGVVVALSGGVWWLGTALWPLRHQLFGLIVNGR